MDVTDQQAVDHRMIELDGTRYKTNLGGNAIYSVSCAAARAAAASGESHYGGTWQRKSRRGYLRRHII